MSDPDLDGTFGFLAGDPALDLVNTVHWRRDDALRFDALVSYRHLLRWGRLAGLLDAAEEERLAAAAGQDPEGGARVLADVVTVREAIHAAALGRSDSATELSTAFARAQGRAVLAHDLGGWRWTDTAVDLQTPLDRVARAAVALLTATPPPAVSECADEACGWLFVDTSRRGNRLWCSAAGCGDRNRARRYYRRHSGTTS